MERNRGQRSARTHRLLSEAHVDFDRLTGRLSTVTTVTEGDTVGCELFNPQRCHLALCDTDSTQCADCCPVATTATFGLPEM